MFRPTCSLSTLRRARYHTRRKTRYLTAGSTLSGPPLQTAGLYALARRNPLQTARESFDLKQLSSDLYRNMASPWPFTVQCLVARATGNQGLPAIRYHTLDPQGFLLAAWLVQVRKPADVVHFTLLLRTAEFTRLRQETLHDFTAMSVHLLGLLVEDAMTVPSEGYSAKPGDQRRLALSACVLHLQHPQWAMRRCDR